MKIISLFIIHSFIICSSLFSQVTFSRTDYIEKYQKLAIREMKRSGIPASITLAQGILESGNGNSRLAKEAKNHFGIKCHENWLGSVIYADDDLQDECFRSYKKVIKSYRDHSFFLISRSRYDELFTLDPRDYKSWAQGLQNSGYATNKEYALRLIKIIESERLFELDISPKNKRLKEAKFGERLNITPNGKCYVIFQEGETIESFAADFGLSINRLLLFNDLIYSSEVKKGDKIYIEKKAKSFSRKLRKVITHRLNFNEDADFISQFYGIQMSQLYRLNDWPVGYQPKEGELVKLQ